MYIQTDRLSGHTWTRFQSDRFASTRRRYSLLPFHVAEWYFLRFGSADIDILQRRYLGLDASPGDDRDSQARILLSLYGRLQTAISNSSPLYGVGGRKIVMPHVSFEMI